MFVEHTLYIYFEISYGLRVLCPTYPVERRLLMAKYISGFAKKGTTTYYFVKDAVTGKLDTDCTRYLKHKVRQNRANNTIKRIAYILPFYMNFLSDKGLTLRAVSDLKFSEQSEHFSDFLMAVKKGAHTGSMKEVKNNTANSYLQAVFGLYDFFTP